MTLQLLIDRVLKRLINQQAQVATPEQQALTSHHLTVREQNAIRYTAWYVATKLTNKYKRHSSNPTLKEKLFVAVLSNMTAVNQPPGVETLDDYTRLWSELIDRGGLYHINDDVYHLIEVVELVVRCHLNKDAMHTYVPGSNIKSEITSHVMQTESILVRWEKIASVIPPKHEKHSLNFCKPLPSYG